MTKQENTGDKVQGIGFADLKPENVPMLLAASAAAYGVGFLSMLISPFLTGAMVEDLGLTNFQAGLMGTAEFIGVMIGNLSIAGAISKLPRAKIALFGAGVVLLGNLLCLALEGVYALAGFRCLIGVGAGLALASGNAAVADAKSPEKMAAQMSFLFVTLMIVTSYLFSFVIARWGYVGACSTIAAMTAIMAIFIRRMPQQEPQSVAAEKQASADRPGFKTLAGGFLLIGALFFSWRDMMHWSFVERVGDAAGYTGSEIGFLLSSQAFVGLLGPLFAILIGDRFGLKIPILIGIALTGAVTYFVISAGAFSALYPFAVMGIAITYFFVLPYITSLAAALDSQGRLVAALGGFMIAGAAIAPASTGYFIDTLGYAAVRWIVLVAVMVTAACFLVPLARLAVSRTSIPS